MPIHVATCCDVTKCTNTQEGLRIESLFSIAAGESSLSDFRF